MLLDNDPAGTLVIPNLTVVESRLNESPTKTLNLTTPHLFLSCTVTRSQKINQLLWHPEGCIGPQ